MKTPQEKNSGKEKQVYFVFWNVNVYVHTNNNITPESKANQQRPLQLMKHCTTVIPIFIAKV